MMIQKKPAGPRIYPAKRSPLPAQAGAPEKVWHDGPGHPMGHNLPVPKKAWRQENNLKIIPLGGCEEVGRNMTVFEYGQDLVILDMGLQFPEEDIMGLQFPEEDMPGIDYVIPNVEYLKGKEKNIRGVIFSHGHLDHIGAAAILLPKLGNPQIIGRPLTLEMVKHRVEDLQHGASKKLKTLYIKDMQDKVQLGAFTLSLFQVDHAIMDAMGVILETPVATIIHPGDWTIEKNPIGRKAIDYSRLAKLKRPTILMLESLGSTNSKESVTEEEMLKNLYSLITNAPGRVIITTFSSQIERVRQLLEFASQNNKKVALDGFSMKLNIELATKLGYIKIPKGVIVPIDKAHSYPDNKVVVICTGGQGEEMAALSRIVAGNHRFVKIKKEDTVIFSSSVVPGNERSVQRLKDNLYRLSDNVYHSDIIDVHISGHSNIEGIKEMLREIKPDYFIPVYANHYFLKEASKIAQGIGFRKDKIFVPDNGSIIKFTGAPSGSGADIMKEKVPSSYVFVDGLGVGDVGEIVLRDRPMLAEDGMFVVVAIIDKKTGRVIGSPDIISRGFVYLRESKDLLSQTRKKVIEIVDKSAGHGGAVNWTHVKDEIRNKVGDFLA
ncbi:MAG: ribonuclease J, partial [Candidatus Staskawiczbacteria bacterium]|nr:ribonuclease J [Candidatus Staskawiczbacteria bacterium]